MEPHLSELKEYKRAYSGVIPAVTRVAIPKSAAAATMTTSRSIPWGEMAPSVFAKGDMPILKLAAL
jgi:hypothetical protein